MTKKRPPTGEVSRLREQLTGAADAELPYDVRWAQRILAGEGVPPPEVLRRELIEALVGELVARTAADALASLAACAQREVSKAARTGLHRLRTQKVDVAVPSPAAEPRSGTGLLESQEPLALITPYDGSNQRAIWLTTPEERGLVIHQARISAARGLVEFISYEATRRKYRELAAHVREQVIVAEVPAPTALWFIEEAARVCREQQRGVPESYLAASRILGAPPVQEHPGLAVAPAEAPPSELLRLYQDRSLSYWLPERDFVQSLLLRLQEIATSRIVVDDRQRRAQIAATIERGLDEYYTPARIAACRRVLLDTTHLLSARGWSELAGYARQAAELFAGPRAALIAHPFARAFLERVIDSVEERQPAEEAPPERKSDGGLILPPR